MLRKTTGRQRQAAVCRPGAKDPPNMPREPPPKDTVETLRPQQMVAEPSVTPTERRKSGGGFKLANKVQLLRPPGRKVRGRGGWVATEKGLKKGRLSALYTFTLEASWYVPVTVDLFPLVFKLFFPSFHFKLLPEPLTYHWVPLRSQKHPFRHPTWVFSHQCLSPELPFPALAQTVQ